MGLEDQLHAHAHALRSLALALVGERHADDLVQDTMVQALQQSEQHVASPRAWLATMMRFLAHKLRRGERRRGEREQAVARRDVVPPDTGHETREVFHRLNAAVEALPEPYQTAILLRYMRELSPTDIGAAMRVPVATVKTRLVRGLALLRERFDAREKERGGDWRGAFAGAFGLERTAAAAAVGVAGGIVMTATMKWMLGGVVAAVFVAGFVSFDGAPSTPVLPVAAGAERGVVASAQLPHSALSPSPDAASATRDAVASVAIASESRITVRGRCVDEDGVPLPGLALELRGRKIEGGMGRDFEREYRDWITARGRNWADQKSETATDGTFVFAAERTPMAVTLRIVRDSLEHTTNLEWLDGDDLDVGDLLVPMACRLRLRVVDAEGRAVPLPSVSVRAGYVFGSHWNARRLALGSPAPLFSSLDGIVTTHVVADHHEVTVNGCTIVRGATLDVPRSVPVWEHEVVVEAASSGETITGTVVDERGVPVANAHVIASHERSSHASTDALGRFVLQRRGQRDGKVELTCVANGFDAHSPAQSAAWGARDCRLVLRDLAAIEVRVVDDVSSEPVTDFAVHVWAARGDSGYESARLGASGEHREGIVRLASIARGEGWLVVDPCRWGLWRSDAVRFVAVGTHVQRVDVRLRRSADRELLVLDRDGERVIGPRVELIDADAAAPDAVGAALRTVAIDRWAPDRIPYSRVLLQQTSDEQGRVMLHGPADRAVVVRILRARAAPFVIGPVRLTDGEPLVATVPVGARVVVNISPPEFVEELLSADPAMTQPGVRLRRGSGNDVEFIPLANEPALRPDGVGRLTIDGVPPGEWSVALEELMTTVFNGGSQSTMSPAAPVASVTLREGETTEANVDLRSWLRATITGTVRCNGKPVADAQVQVQMVRPQSRSSRPSGALHLARTDADGRFHYMGRGGTATVFVERSGTGPIGDRTNWVASTSSVELPPGGNVEHTFDVAPCSVRLRLLASDGSPIVGSGVVLTTPGNWPRHPFGATDPDGRAAGDTEAGTFTVQVGEARTPVGTVNVLPGAPNEFTLIVP